MPYSVTSQSMIIRGAFWRQTNIRRAQWYHATTAGPLWRVLIWVDGCLQTTIYSSTNPLNKGHLGCIYYESYDLINTHILAYQNYSSDLGGTYAGYKKDRALIPSSQLRFTGTIPATKSIIAHPCSHTGYPNVSQELFLSEARHTISLLKCQVHARCRSRGGQICTQPRLYTTTHRLRPGKRNNYSQRLALNFPSRHKQPRKSSYIVIFRSI